MASIETVANRYKPLRFNGIANGLDELLSMAEANEMSHLAFAEMLADHEPASRDKIRIALNLKRASFPVIKRLEEFDYRWQTTITKREINALDFSFIDNRENVISIGPPGVGKTDLASGIGLKAVEAGYKVLFNEYRSLMITTNKDFTKWEEFFFEENVAVPMVDRIIHHSHILMLGGEGYRLKKNTFL